MYDPMTLDESYLAPPLDDGGGTRLPRPPEPDECFSCGSTPALPTVFERNVGLLVLARSRVEGASYCKGCGTDAYRRCQSWNLGYGWWGLYAVLLNAWALFKNARQFRKVKALPPAYTRDPNVVTPRQVPSDGGRRIPERPGMWIAFGILALWIFVANTVD
jgi:hypothetical protein